MKQLAESSLARLRNWDMSPEQIAALVKIGRSQAHHHLPLAGLSGIVTEKKALQGMRFMPGEMLYQVTDLSSVWVRGRRVRAGHRPGEDRREGAT